jgi:hypothetical protein
MADMGEELFDKQAPARPDKALDGVFPDAAPKPEPVEAPAKKAAKKKA